MAKVSEITDPYFSHDFYSRQDRKHILLIDEMGYEGYGLFWAIVEFMHYNQLKVGEERLIAGKDYAEKVEKILNEFELFRIENGEYISDRILRNINKQEEKSKRASAAATAKWAMSALKTAHVEVFGKEPVLDDDEVKTFLNYANKIPNLKDRLHDILYTVQKLKFEDVPSFKGNISWLLQESRLSKLLNGGFGEIRSWQKHKEWLVNKEQRKGLTDNAEEKEFDINSIGTQAEAIELILAHSIYSDAHRTIITTPPFNELIKKFDLSKKELAKMKKERLADA